MFKLSTVTEDRVNHRRNIHVSSQWRLESSSLSFSCLLIHMNLRFSVTWAIQSGLRQAGL